VLKLLINVDLLLIDYYCCSTFPIDCQS